MKHLVKQLVKQLVALEIERTCAQSFGPEASVSARSVKSVKCLDRVEP